MHQILPEAWILPDLSGRARTAEYAAARSQVILREPEAGDEAESRLRR